MAVLSKHPVAAVPGPPARERTGHLLLRAWCVLMLLGAFAAPGLIEAIGAAASGILAVASAIVSAVLWALLRPVVQWRRVPWFATAYVAWSAVCILWSPTPGAAAIAWLMLAITTLQAAFVGAVLTWRELVAAVASALKWCIALSLVAELAAWIVGGPAPAAFPMPSAALAAVAVAAIVVFAIRIAVQAPRRALLVGWLVVAIALLLLHRTGSGSILVAAICGLAVLAAMLVMRTAGTPGGRTRRYVLFAGVAVFGAMVAWLARRWLVDQGGILAHDMWSSVLAQAGVVGVALLAGHYVTGIWRSWFFAVDRPRWDLDAQRPYSPLALLPLLVFTVLVVQGAAATAPLVQWGWMLPLMLVFKIKQAPIVGVAPGELPAQLERGDAPTG